MADTLSLNTNISNAQNIGLASNTTGAQSTTSAAQNNKSLNSIFSNNSLNATTNDYSNDLMMANLNFSSIASGQAPQAVQTEQPQAQAQAQIQPQQEQQAPATTTFTSNATDQLTGCLADQNAPKKSNIGKLIGAIGGFFAPLAGKIVGLCKGQSAKALFNFKQLAITCPLIGAAGLGVGVLVDSYLDTKNAKKPVQQLQAPQTAQPQAQQLAA